MSAHRTVVGVELIIVHVGLDVRYHVRCYYYSEIHGEGLKHSTREMVMRNLLPRSGIVPPPPRSLTIVEVRALRLSPCTGGRYQTLLNQAQRLG